MVIGYVSNERQWLSLRNSEWQTHKGTDHQQDISHKNRFWSGTVLSHLVIPVVASRIAVSYTFLLLYGITPALLTPKKGSTRAITAVCLFVLACRSDLILTMNRQQINWFDCCLFVQGQNVKSKLSKPVLPTYRRKQPELRWKLNNWSYENGKLSVLSHAMVCLRTCWRHEWVYATHIGTLHHLQLEQDTW